MAYVASRAGLLPRGHSTPSQSRARSSSTAKASFTLYVVPAYAVRAAHRSSRGLHRAVHLSDWDNASCSRNCFASNLRHASELSRSLFKGRSAEEGHVAQDSSELCETLAMAPRGQGSSKGPQEWQRRSDSSNLSCACPRYMPFLSVGVTSLAIGVFRADRQDVDNWTPTSSRTPKLPSLPVHVHHVGERGCIHNFAAASKAQRRMVRVQHR